MKELVVEMKIIADGVIHHVTEVLPDLQIFLAAIMTKFTFQDCAAV